LVEVFSVPSAFRVFTVRDGAADRRALDRKAVEAMSLLHDQLLRASRLCRVGVSRAYHNTARLAWTANTIR
jgi:hypothetical protein